MVQEMKLMQRITQIKEDGEGPIPTPGTAPIGTAPLAQAQNAAATNAGSIGSYVVPGTGRQIVKRRRTFKHVKFEAPKDMKKDK
jgi:hypothetical protein